MKEDLKSGLARIGTCVRFSLRIWKALSSLLNYKSFTSSLTKVCNSLKTLQSSWYIFCNSCKVPDHTVFMFFGIENGRTAPMFLILDLMQFAVIWCVKNSTLCIVKWHFSILTLGCTSVKAWNTWVKCALCCSNACLYIKISSMYDITDLSINFCNTCAKSIWNDAEELHRPKANVCIDTKWVMKVIFLGFPPLGKLHKNRSTGQMK